VDSGDGHQDTVIKVKLWDKPKSIQMLFKHLGLLRDRIDLGVTLEAQAILERLAEGRRRVSEAR